MKWLHTKKIPVHVVTNKYKINTNKISTGVPAINTIHTIPSHPLALAKTRTRYRHCLAAKQLHLKACNAGNIVSALFRAPPPRQPFHIRAATHTHMIFLSPFAGISHGAPCVSHALQRPPHAPRNIRNIIMQVRCSGSALRVRRCRRRCRRHCRRHEPHALAPGLGWAPMGGGGGWRRGWLLHSAQRKEHFCMCARTHTHTVKLRGCAGCALAGYNNMYKHV